MTFYDVLRWGSIGLLVIIVAVNAIAAAIGFALLLRDETWPAMVAAWRWGRRKLEARRLWREQRRSKVARALSEQVVARREGR